MVSILFRRDLSRNPQADVIVHGPYASVALKNKKWMMGKTYPNQPVLDQYTIAKRNHDGTWDVLCHPTSGCRHYEEWEILPYPLEPKQTPVKQAKRRTVLIQPNPQKKEPTHGRS